MSFLLEQEPAPRCGVCVRLDRSKDKEQARVLLEFVGVCRVGGWPAGGTLAPASRTHTCGSSRREVWVGAQRGEAVGHGAQRGSDPADHVLGGPTVAVE